MIIKRLAFNGVYKLHINYRYAVEG